MIWQACGRASGARQRRWTTPPFTLTTKRPCSGALVVVCECRQRADRAVLTVSEPLEGGPAPVARRRGGAPPAQRHRGRPFPGATPSAMRRDERRGPRRQTSPLTTTTTNPTATVSGRRSAQARLQRRPGQHANRQPAHAVFPTRNSLPCFLSGTGAIAGDARPTRWRLALRADLRPVPMQRSAGTVDQPWRRPPSYAQTSRSMASRDGVQNARPLAGPDVR